MTNKSPQDPLDEPWLNSDGTPFEPPDERGPKGQIWRGPGDPKPRLGVIGGDKEEKDKSKS